VNCVEDAAAGTGRRLRSPSRSGEGSREVGVLRWIQQLAGGEASCVLLRVRPRGINRQEKRRESCDYDRRDEATGVLSLSLSLFIADTPFPDGGGWSARLVDPSYRKTT
jgi:hypothetical protein